MPPRRKAQSASTRNRSKAPEDIPVSVIKSGSEITYEKLQARVLELTDQLAESKAEAKYADSHTIHRP